MKKSIVLFDVDMTIYSEYSIFSLTKYLIKMELLGDVVEVKMMEKYGEYKLGIKSYSETATSLVWVWAEALKGLSYTDIEAKTKDFFEENKDKFYPYFEQLLPELKKTHEIYLVTAGPQFVAEAIKERFGLDGYFSTEFEVLDGTFTGKVVRYLTDGKQMVEETVAKYEGNSLAFGDSENDIGMLEKVTTPICINPTEKLLEVARERGWMVVNDLDAYEKVTELLKV